MPLPLLRRLLLQLSSLLLLPLQLPLSPLSLTSSTVSRAIVDKAVESARDDFEEHVLKGGSFYVEDLERMKHSTRWHVLT